ncbi:M10 family metallopeptidase [Crocosphaera sp. UHCC 0190]|uniref:M10 family metallopeptidase n=1 Tax=Crocosphaera sp. UHCC 0190 TaxID=3110246 RepID=UPI002B1FF40D|nr:M10 family metallopeptidase [Crocosphaera sp. UHCC 0190]MEA5510329.1 M10 family metallopeptidase [Crocosphaera sp. UHCC 0190]
MAILTSLSSIDIPLDSILSGYEWSVSNDRKITYSFYEDDVFKGSYYGTEKKIKEVSNAVKENIRDIFGWLENVIDIDFVEVTETDTNTFGQIRFMNSSSPNYAYANFPYSLSEKISGDVYFNTKYDRLGDTNGFQHDPGKHGYLTIVHELGHALGLQHTFDGGLDAALDNTDHSVMTYNFTGKSAGTYMPLDIKALQSLYGAKDYNTGDNTYVFGSYIDQFTVNGISPLITNNRTKQTIWDSGGKDTLDFSGLNYQSSGFSLDLNPGGLLSITYTTTTDYATAIAYDVTIENVINSSSNDTIYLNSGANTISGYLTSKTTGSDIIYYGDSQDTLKLDYKSKEVTSTQSGQDLILGLGSNGSIKLVNYYLDPDNQINIIYSDINVNDSGIPDSSNNQLIIELDGTTQTGILESYGNASVYNGKSSPQDTTQAIVTYSSDGNEVTIDNNGWKQFSLDDYNITANTVLTFEFKSTKKGEIQGIGFDNDDDVFNNTNGLFQLYGSQDWGNQAFNDYKSSDGWKTYTIKAGNYISGTYDRLVFINDDDKKSGNSSQFRNIKVYNVDELAITVDKNTQTGILESYGNASVYNGKSSPQDTTQAIVTYSSDGNEVTIDNNGWKQFSLDDYNITANTVLTFEFKSSKEGEIQGIGFDNNDDVFDNTNGLFQLYGSQDWGNQAFNDYKSSDGWKTYTINVGNYINGTYDRLVFINDDDKNSGNSSQFRNIKVYNANELSVTVNGITQTTSLQSYGNASVYNGKSSPQDTAKAIVTYSSDGNEVKIENTGWKHLYLNNYNITANTVLTFEFKSTKKGEIQGIGFDNNDDVFDNPDGLFQLYGSQDWGNQAFNDYKSSNDWKTYTINVGNYLNGNYDRLVFINDDDKKSGHSSQFRNIKINESGGENILTNKTLPEMDLTGIARNQPLVGLQELVEQAKETPPTDTLDLGNKTQTEYNQNILASLAAIAGLNNSQSDVILDHNCQTSLDAISAGQNGDTSNHILI